MNKLFHVFTLIYPPNKRNVHHY